MDLVPGQMYEVTWRQQSGNYQWYEWRMRATYLGYDSLRGEQQFSLRPLFGTTAIREGDVLDAVKSVSDKPIAPKRKRGAIPAPVA